MMKWAGLAFLGLVAVTLWDGPRDWRGMNWTGIQPPVVVLKATDSSDAAHAAQLLAAKPLPSGPWRDDDTLVQHSAPDTAPIAAWVVQRPALVGTSTEVILVRGMAPAAAERVAIALVDTRTGQLLGHPAYPLEVCPRDREEAQDEAELDRMGHDI